MPTSRAADTISSPEPARSMTLDECKKNMGGSARVYIKSRFAVCTAQQVTTVWAKKSGSIGTSTYYVYIRGSVPKEADRTMSFDYNVTGFKTVGKTGVAGLKIGLRGVIPKELVALLASVGVVFAPVALALADRDRPATPPAFCSPVSTRTTACLTFWSPSRGIAD